MNARAAGTPEATPVLVLERVSKRYPGTLALCDADWRVHAGAVNVLVGENGAGKSTMMKIIAGVEQPTGGRVLLDGVAVQLSSPEQARRHGIGIVFQELNLFPNLTIVENLFVGRELRSAGGMIDAARQRKRAREVLALLEHELDPDLPVGALRVGQQQVVEIARALVSDTRILILDEPTSALSAPEVEVLFKVIAGLKARGVAIVYISHRLEELVRIGDHVTVLRDGRITGSARMADVDVPWIVRQMVGPGGRDIARATDATAGPVVLEVRGVRLPRAGSPGWRVDGVSLELRRGEVLGIYGLMGAGRTELLECISGCHPDTARGSVRLGGRELMGRDVGDCIAAGLALVPEDRKADGLVHTLAIGGNLTLASLRQLAREGRRAGGLSAWLSLGLFGWAGGWVGASRERQAVDEQVRSMTIKTRDPALPIGSLSGGNQQKVVIGRALMTGPRVLLLDEPSRGIDIGARAEVFRVMRGLAAEGMAVLFVSSELQEVMALSDRVIVMSNGRVTAHCSAAEATEEALVAASAVGHGLQRRAA